MNAVAPLLALVALRFLVPDAPGREVYADPVKGDDTAPGTIERPWRTLAHGVSRLAAGDTLYLRQGVFAEKGISIAVPGTAAQPVTIRNYPNERAVIDGAFPEFRALGNHDWEIVDSAREIYVSKRSYPDPKILHGYFKFRGTWYSLVGYDDYADLSAASEFASPDVPFYVGPGAHWRKSDGRIVLRMAESRVATSNGYGPPGLLTDPRTLELLLFGEGTVLRIEKDAAYVNLEGLTVQGQEHALDFAPDASHVVVRNCRLIGGRFHVVIGRDAHDLLFDEVVIDGGVPDWIAWLDVKNGRAPAKHLQAPGMKLSRGVHRLEVRNCTFQRLFDAINANDAGHDLFIHHNLMEDIRDDCLQLGTYTYAVEFAYNRMIRVSKGPSFQGRGDSTRPGTKYYHHNIIDCSKRWLFARRSPDGTLAKLDRVKYINDRGEVWARPAGSHGDRANDPWKVYHNTILFGQELNDSGMGFEYMHGSRFDPAVPQEFYNNIVIQVADYPASSGARVADGSQIFDGNLYFRMSTAATSVLLRKWAGVGEARDFRSLEEFKASPLFAESKHIYPPGFENSGMVADPRLDEEYRPVADGPAASGAVALPARWPGNKGERFRGALPPVRLPGATSSPAAAAPQEYYADPVNGDDGAAGDLARPWRTLSAAVPRLRPGDTLSLRAGVFPEKDVAIAVRGTPDRWITIRNFPGEAVVIDGALPEFRRPGNDDWERVDPGLQLYASKRSYPCPAVLHGYFEYRGTWYRMVGYDDYADLTARSQFASPANPFYIGPGVHWRKSDGRIYARLVESDLAGANGYALAGLPDDPRRLPMLLFGHSAVLRLEREAAYVRLEGLIVQGQEHALEFAWGGPRHIVVDRCRFLGGRFPVFLGPHTRDVVFDGVTVDGGTPDWIAWLDVKNGRRPGRHLESPGIRVSQDVDYLEVRNSVFRRLFDGINSNDGGSHAHIHHNRFELIRDDCYQLGSHTHDIEFAYNQLIKVSKGPSFQGRGDSPRPGTKYYHHNLIDCDQRWLFARRNADGGLATLARVKFINERGEVWARPVGSHGSAAKDPWKVYHNTVIFGQELNGSGLGLESMNGSKFDRDAPQEVYNNIFVQVADYWVSSGARVGDGSQRFDGNLYFRVPANAKAPFLRQWIGATGARDFRSLGEFKASPLFAESRRIHPPGFENSGAAGDPRLDPTYHPAVNGPAGSGAVALPADWPGNKGEEFRGALAPAPRP